MSTPPRYLTVAEVAARLHYSPRHVRRLIEAGELRAYRPAANRRLALLESEVEAFMRPDHAIRAEQYLEDGAA